MEGNGARQGRGMGYFAHPSIQHAADPLKHNMGNTYLDPEHWAAA